MWLPFGFLFAFALGSALPSRPVALHVVRMAGAESCIAPHALAQHVEALTGPRFVAPSADAVSIEVALARRGEAFEARIVRTEGAAGASSAPRLLHAHTARCAGLDALLVFVIALMVDPSLSSADLPPELLLALPGALDPGDTLLAELAAEPPQPAPVGPPTPPADEPPASLPPATAVQRGAVVPSALVRSAGAHVPLVGAGVALALAVPRWAPLYLMAYAARAPDTGAEPSPGLASLTALAADAGLCPLSVRPGRARLSACAGASVGRLFARGRGYSSNRPAQLWDVALSANLGGAFMFSRRLGVELTLSARFRLSNGSFRGLDGEKAETVYRPLRVDGLASLGPRVEF